MAGSDTALAGLPPPGHGFRSLGARSPATETKHGAVRRSWRAVFTSPVTVHDVTVQRAFREVTQQDEPAVRQLSPTTYSYTHYPGLGRIQTTDAFGKKHGMRTSHIRGTQQFTISYRGQLLFHVIHQLGEPLVFSLQIGMFLLQLLMSLAGLAQRRDGLGAEVRGQIGRDVTWGRNQVRSGHQVPGRSTQDTELIG